MADLPFSAVRLRLSALTADPLVRDAFERAERDDGAAFAIVVPFEPLLLGGAAVEPETADA